MAGRAAKKQDLAPQGTFRGCRDRQSRSEQEQPSTGEREPGRQRFEYPQSDDLTTITARTPRLTQFAIDRQRTECIPEYRTGAF
jgi:hypothetical protein